MSTPTNPPNTTNDDYRDIREEHPLRDHFYVCIEDSGRRVVYRIVEARRYAEQDKGRAAKARKDFLCGE